MYYEDDGVGEDLLFNRFSINELQREVAFNEKGRKSFNLFYLSIQTHRESNARLGTSNPKRGIWRKDPTRTYSI